MSLLCMVLTVLTAYPLSRTNKQLFGRTVLAWIFFIPMIFNGGLIPSYMVVSTLGLLGAPFGRWCCPAWWSRSMCCC